MEHLAWLKLIKSATEQLTEMTNNANHRKWLEVSVEDLHVVKANINTTIKSGITIVNRPSTDLKHLLKVVELLRRQI